MKFIGNTLLGRYTKAQLFSVYCDLFSKYAIVSYQRSGHTWLRVMLAKVISLKYNVHSMDLDLIKMAKNNQKIPKIGIYHLSHAYFNINVDWRNLKINGTYPKNSRVRIKNSLLKKKIIYLVRDPRDVVVSLYFDLKKRHHLYHRDLSNFIREDYSLNRIIKCMNIWYHKMLKNKDQFLFLKYEDMKVDTFTELKRVTSFLNIDVSDEILMEAVEFGSIKNMKRMELENTFSDSRLKPKNVNDKDSYKVRKAKVGGYKDYLSETDLSLINQKISEGLLIPDYK